MSSALCKTLGMNPDLFYQDYRGQPYKVVTQSVKRVCESCHVRDDCLDYALTHNIKDGLWGGMTRSERIKIKRRQLMLDRSA
jgi:WhiB family transcriptional regulator, redox-sensing transcriptional regulator